MKTTQRIEKNNSMTTNRDEDSKIKLGKSELEESANDLLKEITEYRERMKTQTLGDLWFEALEEIKETIDTLLKYKPLFIDFKRKKDERQAKDIKHRRSKKASSRVSRNIKTTKD